MTSLRGKICFITGAASGIGRALAEACAKEGARLVLTDINEAPLMEVAERLRAAGGQVLAASRMDVSDYAAVRAFAQQMLVAHGSMDVVANVAGIAIWGDIMQLSHDDWRAVVDVNLMGPIHVMECLVPAMVAAGRGGHIVNVSSAAGLFALPFHAAYSASKFGLRGVSEVLRFDLRRHGIHVSVVCPGAVNTGLVNTLKIAGVDQDDPQIAVWRRRFQRHAVSPERAARAILKGVARQRFIIYTSPDIRLAYWVKRVFPLPYVWGVRFITGRIQAIADRQARGRAQARE